MELEPNYKKATNQDAGPQSCSPTVDREETRGDVGSSWEDELIRSWAEREFARERWRLFRERILFFAELGLLLGVFGLGGIVILVSQSRFLQATTLTALFAFARPIVKHLTSSGPDKIRT